MVVLKLVTSLPRSDRSRIRGQRAELRESQRSVRAEAKVVVDDTDYNDMPLEEWKTALRKDVEERFGPVPNDLVPAGEPGW